MRDISIGGRLIGSSHPPFIVAEMSGNHNQSLERALAIVDAAARAGAHALKLQTYTADTMTLDISDGEFFIADPKSLWKGKSLYQLYNEAYTPWEWHQPIFDRCKELGLIAFSTPFDETAVDFLETLDVPAYKIASFENTDIPLIKRVAATGKPVIISTGMAAVADLDETVNAVRDAGCNDLILLKCTSTYPADPSDSNIMTVPHIRQLFGCQVGLSDHTRGTAVSIASVALGTTFIEKHFTLRRADGGVDSQFSLEPDELSHLVEGTYQAWQALGSVRYGRTEAEQGSLMYRRSLYVTRDLEPGDALTGSSLGIIRPGHGLEPKFYEIVLGMQVTRPVKRGTALTWEILKQ